MSLPPGVFAAAVTPFSEGGRQVDLDWIAAHLAYLEENGADGVLTLGTTGEGPSLSLEERRQVIDAVLGHRRRLWVLVGTGCASLTDTIEISRYACRAGADAVMIVPPFYYKGVDDRGLMAYYDAVMAALPAEARVILYNIPDVTAVEISDDLLDYLIARQPKKVAGIKDTSGRLERLEGYIQRYPQLSVYVGSDDLIASGLKAGALGAISAAANIYPQLVRDVRQRLLAGEDAESSQAAIDRVLEVLRRYPTFAAIKHWLRIAAGLPQTYVRPPLRDLTPQEAAALEQEVGQAVLL